MGRTLTVESLLNCSEVSYDIRKSSVTDPLDLQTIVGCLILNTLQSSFRYSFNYTLRGSGGNLSYIDRREVSYPRADDEVDLYARPMSLRTEILDFVYPIEEIFVWRCGFILLREDFGLFHAFYSKPFDSMVWAWLFLMLFIASALLLTIAKWERNLGWLKGECSIVHETLFAVGAYCQNAVTVETVLSSRRIACTTFCTFAYVIYTFYNSNLLSHLVSDRQNEMTLDDLVNGDYTCAVTENMVVAVAVVGKLPEVTTRIVKKMMAHINIMNLTTGLEAVKTGRVALLVDYMTAYPLMEKELSDSQKCQLVEVDLLSGMKKYMFASRKIPIIYYEILKLSILRLKEAGLINRMIGKVDNLSAHCTSVRHVSTGIVHVVNPLIILGCTYVFSFIVLVCERAYYKSTNTYLPFAIVNS